MGHHGFLLLVIWLQLAPAYGRSWRLKVYTADADYAGCDSGVYIDIKGVYGTKSESLWGEFERGSIDTWDIDAGIGDPQTIEIEKDGVGLYEEWKLTKMTMEDLETGRLYTFWCDCWIHWYDPVVVTSSDTPGCYYIDQCQTGQRQCGWQGLSDSICWKCNDPYYGGSWGNGCQLCPHIDHCVDRYCSSWYDTKCRTCENNYVQYRPSSSGTSCVRMCGYQSSAFYDCWPGQCGDGTVNDCRCATGFYLDSSSSHTICQLGNTLKPSIETCQMEAVGPNLEKRRSESGGPTTHCQYQNDFYGNFQPTSFSYDVTAMFRVDLTSSYLTQPSYLLSYGFGLYDIDMQIVLQSMTGAETFISQTNIMTRSSPIDTSAQSGSLSLQSNYLSDGKRLCLKYIATGGGNVQVYDYWWANTNGRDYDRKAESRTLCYRYDISPPIHCLETSSCSVEPLVLATRISNTPNIYVEFQGWEDPVPDGGTNEHASSIEHYEISVHEVIGSNGPLQVDLSPVFSQVVDANTKGLTLNIPTGDPRLYCVKVEVKDYASNVRHARRFFLYDESSSIESNPDKVFYVASASPDSNYQWQTPDKDVCLDWKDYFYNKFYLENNLLNQIQPDPSGFISGVFEQNTGTLPVSGTPNVYGIIRYMFSFSKNGGNFSAEIEVPDFMEQTFCSAIDDGDGDTLILKIRAIDIAENTYAEERVLRIDGTEPLIENIGLEKDGYNTLFVHDETDLSKMKLQFDAYDPQSGIKTVEWHFGVIDYSDIVDSGAIGVYTFNQTSCPLSENCYCPIIGDCEALRYEISLDGLVEIHKRIGNHNRNYYFTLKVTNYADLVTTEHVDILVDDSPPETGVIWEGPEDYPDIDYTSDDTLTVTLHGFIDHESGVRLYRIGLASYCLTKEELYQMNASRSDVTFAEAVYPENVFTLPANFTGKRYVTGIALNNAMDPSEAVCSDGITKDITPPVLYDVVIENARWAEHLYCYDNTTWLLRSDLIRMKLSNTQICNAACGTATTWELPEAFAFTEDSDAIFECLLNRTLDLVDLTNEKNTSTISDFICSVFPLYDNNNMMYLPNDHLFIHWNVEEDLSQIQDFYVGFGRDDSEKLAPELLSYISTDKKTNFKMHHDGIGTDLEFFIFLKAVNKAGLETVLPIGPILIDETPPHNQSLPEVIIEGDDIMVGWHNDTFYDDEQSTQIDRVAFEIAHDNISVTPVSDWRLHTAIQCSQFTGGCFRYPLKNLQEQDTDQGYSFYATMYVYNIAGHFLTARTPEFTLPSTYPPSHAVVADIDPATDTDTSLTEDDDVDAHFTLNTVCAKWYGFHHHEYLKLEFGVGSSKGQDDIVSFSDINDVNSHCFISSSIPDAVTVFVSLRASSTAGSTISSSDGVTIYNTFRVLQEFKVFNGPECFVSGNLMSNISHASEEPLVFSFPLHIGKTYTLCVLSQNISEMNAIPQSTDIYIKEIVSENNRHDIIFKPYIVYPVFTFPLQVNVLLTTELYACEEDSSTIVNNDLVIGHWKGISNQFTFESAVVKLLCPNVSVEECLEFQTVYDAVEVNLWNAHELFLQSQTRYHIAVRPCLNSYCASPKLSSEFSKEPDIIALDIVKSETALVSISNCTVIWVEWRQPDYVNVSFYQWSMMTKIGQSTMMSAIVKWQNVGGGNIHQEFIKIQECVYLPVHAFKETFACVRAFTPAGQMTQSCRLLEEVTEENSYRNTVYEIDGSSDSWIDIQQVIRSSYIGTNLKLLHEADLDFHTTKTDIVGAVLNGHSRNITWYLMTSNSVPLDCSASPECKYSRITTEGYVELPSRKLSFDTLYYICADAPESERITGGHREIISPFHACSNGFILDDTPPTGGVIHVKNVNGYINSLTVLAVTWEGFSDNIDATIFGFENNIKFYTVEIGSSPLSHDIRQDHVGDNTALLVEDLELTSGTPVFVSVIATDHAGLETRVSSNELIVDTTPPVLGRIELETASTTRWIEGDILSFQLLDFTDEESGIDKYVTFVGSSRYATDILAETETVNKLTEISLEGTDVSDGHFYYLGAKAVNRAGLSSHFAFYKFGVDRSPPTGGHVMDGFAENDKDVDFQIDVSHIAGHWKGFFDPHSGISFYRVGLGTEPFLYDVEPSIHVGLRTDILWNSTFAHGQKYYITVEACNSAGLCRFVSSDGVILDNTPPTPGLVRVGSNDYHRTYVPRNSFVEIFWAGFEDPQSGMGRYEACVGSMPGACDIVPEFNCLLALSHVRTGLELPVNTKLFVTVVGYNKNNQSAIKTSDYFIVDNTPPELIEKPIFVANHSHSDHIAVQWEKSVIHLKWMFSDDESRVVKHVVSLASHHEGHTPVEHIEVEDNHRLTINLDGRNWLHNGDTYRAIVTACNAAGLCTSAESNELLIDSTPPHMGGFRTGMTWQNYIDADNHISCRVKLSWYGFHDQESGIKFFRIGVGRTFSENELTNGYVEIDANLSGDVYDVIMKLNDPLSAGDKIVVSLLAENFAGLISSVARVTLIALASATGQPETDYGFLEIERHSCDIHFCNKDCTCSVVGNVCTEVQTNSTCNYITDAITNSLNISVLVYGGLENNSRQITASSSCISAHWIIETGDSEIKRFEWTLGLQDEPYGVGFFDLIHEDPWIDVADFRYGIFCLPLNSSLLHNTHYLVYVKVWVNSDTFIILRSEPLMVDHTPPAVRKGRFVIDSDTFCSTDYDFIDWTDHISVCWDGVFFESQGNIAYYTVALGTVPGADDIINRRSVGLNVTFDASRLTVSHGQHYYFTVSAYNNVGLYASANSDGFTVDTENPVAGIVFNTVNHRNYAVQSTTESFDLSWHGFLDHDTGIKAYYVAIFEGFDKQVMVRNFTNVSLQTKMTFTGLDLEHGKTYVGAVKAKDAAGHESMIVYSNPKLVDTTPPKPYTCQNVSEIFNIKQNVSRNKPIVIPTVLILGSYYSVSGRVTNSEKHPPIKFMVKQKIGEYLPCVREHGGSFKFHYSFYPSFEGTYGAILETDDTEPVVIDVSLKRCTVVPDDNTNAVLLSQISSSAFKISVKAVDMESKVKRTLLGFGTTPYGYQLLTPYPIDGSNDEIVTLSASHGTPVYATAIAENFAGLQSVFISDKIVIDHTAPVIENVVVEEEIIYMAVMDDSAAENSTAAGSSNPQINANNSARNDNVTLTSEEGRTIRLKISWQVSDDEIGIQMCLVSFGTLAYREDILASQVVSNWSESMTVEFNVTDGTRLYTNVKCVNNIGLFTVKVADSIAISLKAPKSDEAKTVFIPSSMYVGSDSDETVQPNQTYIQFAWDGFTNDADISYYEYRLLSDNTDLVGWTEVGTKTFVSLNAIGMEDNETCTAEVRSVNSGHLRSNVTTAAILIESKAPLITGQDMRFSISKRTVTLNWENVFHLNPGVSTTFDVTVGSSSGFADLLDKQSWTSSNCSFAFPNSSIITGKIQELYVTVTAEYTTGLRSTYRTVYNPGF